MRMTTGTWVEGVEPGWRPFAGRAARCAASAALALTAAACGAGAGSVPASDAPEPLRIGAENVVTVTPDRIIVGPIVSGELRPARTATVRAEVGGSITEVAVEEGQSLQRGALLGRIETRALEDVRLSAQSAVRSAEHQLDLARREVERTDMLVEAGALAVRDLDLARGSVASAEAHLADARSRLAAAERQLADTVLRAPFDGVVAARSVNAGDVVTVGDSLFTIIDPSSMRLEGSVPSDDLSRLRVGSAVEFTVRGYDQRFAGRIERIAPQADPVTRQVPIYVGIPNGGGRLVAGLYAEGRVVDVSADGLVVPINAVNTRDDAPWVLRVAGGTVERVPVSLGLRDPRTERVQITAGVAEGDTLLRGAAQGIAPGTPVQVAGRK